MILSRIIHHLKTQNWTAVALEFVIVIAGVVIGFQVTAWNQTREGEARGRGYLERIEADLTADLASYDDRMAFWATVSDYGLRAISATHEEDRIAGVEQDWPIVLAFFQASQVSEFNAIQTTYTEITSVGELGLIDNLDLREGLAKYYSLTGNFTLTERPAYRETVRGIIPIQLQLYIWENCWSADFEGRQVLTDCNPPEDGAEISQTASTLLTDHDLHRQLRYWVSTLQVLATMGRDRRGAAAFLLHAIEAERESAR